jgi:hypothetical protein
MPNTYSFPLIDPPPSSGTNPPPTGTTSPDLVINPNVAPTERAFTPQADIKLQEFVNQVRLFMRDYRELNRLIDGVEHSNRQIVWAIMDCLDDFNTTPPFTQFTLFTFPSRSLLLRGVACSLLESLGILQTRNHLNFSDGGLQVGINDKTQYIQSWLQLMKNQYEEKKLRIKVAYNIETAWGGGVFSEYRFINNFYGEW